MTCAELQAAYDAATTQAERDQIMGQMILQGCATSQGGGTGNGPPKPPKK